MLHPSRLLLETYLPRRIHGGTQDDHDLGRSRTLPRRGVVRKGGVVVCVPALQPQGSRSGPCYIINRLRAHLRLLEEMEDELPRPPQQQQLQLVWALPDLGTAVEPPPPPPPQGDLLTLIQNLTTRLETLEGRVAELSAALEIAAWTTSGWVDYPTQ